MELFLIDAIGPFFRGYREGKRVNWSKIPFEHLETNGEADRDRLEGITEDLVQVFDRVKSMGYNAVTLDDVAHMLPHPDYEPEVNRKLEVYAEYYAEWIRLARERDLNVFITTDFFFSTPAIQLKVGRGLTSRVRWFRDVLKAFFVRYSDVAGVILRIGEVDGKDVKGDFRSHLAIRTPRHARCLLRTLLPLFESQEKHLIFRLWSVGAYPVGDLIWNRKTLHQVFDPFDSPNLILSIKHGESDFFRHLPLNKQFLRTRHKKIVELQARREYEGCGEFPSYIGSDVEKIRSLLHGVPGLIGMSVWCQTGGWTRFHRLTFLEERPVWNEINTWVCIRIFRYGDTAREALESYAAGFLEAEQAPALIEMMNASDQAVKTLLYIDEFAERKLFFRRVRLPSTLSVYWDRILIVHPVRKILRCLVDNGEAKVAQGQDALRVVRHMRTLAQREGLPMESLDFMVDTFEILAEARIYYFRPFSEEHTRKLKALIRTYQENYPSGYSVRMELTPFTVRSRTLRIFLRALLREKRGYRAFDHLITVRLLSLVYPVLRRFSHGVLPDFVHKQAMGLEAVFK